MSYSREAASVLKLIVGLASVLLLSACNSSVDSPGSKAPEANAAKDASEDPGEGDSVLPADAPAASRARPETLEALELPEFPAESDEAPAKHVEAQERQLTVADYASERQQLDATLWNPEVDAQRHEEPFIRLWDDLRASDQPVDVLAAFPFRTLTIGQLGEMVETDLGIKRYQLRAAGETFTPDSWRQWLSDLRTAGYQLEQTEWHHARFQRQSPTRSESRFNIVLDVYRSDPSQRVTVRGELIVVWDDTSSSAPTVATIEIGPMEMLVRDANVAFQATHRITTDEAHRRVMPLIVHDFDGDDRSDLLLGGLNRIDFNLGDGRFRSEPIRPEGLEIFDAAVLADFTGDGIPDLVSVGTDRMPIILAGDAQGRFSSPPRQCADFYLEFPKSFTAGDVDGDGDLDLWIAQYKFPYQQGAMPTPFYDANDGYPAVLLANDGQGNFRDITEAAGLARKRNRRTYSSSLVDLDDDGDLDLLVVSDFSGIDIYRNDGEGQFEEVTSQWADERHLFGMAHTLADFDLDGLLDFYVIGMSSTTARRLDAMGLGRDDHPDINRMRQAMGYGNRMYLARGNSSERHFVRPDFASQVARTGWSWGTTAFDFDNDGDRDIYVANGHNSGKSARDYCTRYWCHDVYTGSSAANRELGKLFNDSLRELHRGEISWNGFEHNVLLMNESGKGFVNTAYLMGIAFEYDSRAVVSDDLNLDGRPDLLVTQYQSENSGDVEYELHVMQNMLPVGRHWIGVRLPTGPGIPSPIGARIVVLGPDRPQVARIVTGDSFSCQHASAVHFGLGRRDHVDAVEIEWFDGTKRRIEQPAIDRWHVVSPDWHREAVSSSSN